MLITVNLLDVIGMILCFVIVAIAGLSMIVARLIDRRMMNRIRNRSKDVK